MGLIEGKNNGLRNFFPTPHLEKVTPEIPLFWGKFGQVGKGKNREARATCRPRPKKIANFFLIGFREITKSKKIANF